MKGRLSKKGLVLVGVLWLVMLLTLMTAAIGQNSRLDTKVSLARVEQVRCKWACRAGVETAMGLLNEDLKESDYMGEYWSESEEDYNNVVLERCQYTVRVTDESSKLNINTATKDQLMGLPDMVEEIADAIIDWRDNDDTASGSGVEGGYYENLTYGYPIRNGSFRTIRELLLVKGMTEELLYGEDTNLNGELDYNERDGETSEPVDNEDDELDEGWIAYLTCYSYDTNQDAEGNSRVNVNNGDESSLSSSLGVSQSQARWIVENRQYSSIGDLVSNESPAGPSGSSGGNNQSERLDLQTFYSIADKVSVDGSEKIVGRVNINTASAEVLTALLGGDREAERVAGEIVGQRSVSLSGMESISEVMESSLMDLETFKRVANDLTTRSNVYMIRCFARADRAGRAGMGLVTEAVVDRSTSPCKLLYWYQGAKN